MNNRPIMKYGIFGAERIYYASNKMYNKNLLFISKLLWFLNRIINSCDINPMTQIGKGVYFPHSLNIVIGKHCRIGDECIIHHNVTIGQNRFKYAKIGNRCSIFSHVLIAGDIHLKDDSVVSSKTMMIK